MKIFSEKHQGLQEELDRNGYVRVNLLPLDVVSNLLHLYNSQPNAKNNYFGFHVTLDLKDAAKIDEIALRISKEIRSYTDSYFEDYKFISPRFAVKEAHENSLIPPHQDWSFVDESKYQSYNLWIAITPSTFKNGTLGFLRGSHNKLKNIRATPLPVFKVPFHDYAYALTDKLEYLELEPGQAFLFNSRIIHASKPNQTVEKRINIAVEITDANADLIHYNLAPNNRTISEYKIDDAFFTKYSNAKLTEMHKKDETIKDYMKIRVFDNLPQTVSVSELLND